MEKKQTAVKWLVQQIYGDMWTQDEDIEKLVHKAKEMEKEQHKETFKQSRQCKIFEKDMPPVWQSWEQYYNKKFSK